MEYTYFSVANSVGKDDIMHDASYVGEIIWVFTEAYDIMNNFNDIIPPSKMIIRDKSENTTRRKFYSNNHLAELHPTTERVLRSKLHAIGDPNVRCFDDEADCRSYFDDYLRNKMVSLTIIHQEYEKKIDEVESVLKKLQDER